ncbi:MAG: (2Fe-2S)-binding protein [Bacteroidales bacterium]|nr:(2Fe-2S)-binding protein [Bacteroidales bacterium]
MITLTVNGEKKSLDIDPDMPLLWVLRDILGLTGTKFGCGEGFCGSCSVLVDHESVRSCSTPISDVANKSITTIEGLSKINPKLQENWELLDVPQCGYCQPGQLITAAALLETNPHPTEQQIVDAMTGNICRCGTYHRIKEAIVKTVESK